MGTNARFNLMLERLIRRILEPLYLFKDSLKKPRVFAPQRALWIGLVCSLVLVSGILATTPRAFAAIPPYLNFQGKLTDSDGNPVADGSYSITFRLYSAETGDTALWTETQSVTISDGVFTVALGTTTSLDLDFDTQYWLSVQVSGDTEMSPRQRLTSAGYALNADNLDTLTSRSFLRRNADDTVEGQITFNYTGTPIVIQPSSASTANTKLINVKDTDGTSQFSVDYEGDVVTAGTFTVGEDGTGYDIKFYGATSGKYLLWDGSADDLILAGTTSLVGDENATFAGTIQGGILTDGTASLTSGAITGATTASFSGQITSTLATDTAPLNVTSTTVCTNLNADKLDGKDDSDFQAVDTDLTAIAGLATTDGNFIVGNGSTWIAENGSTARSSLGLGTIATQAANNVNIDGGAIDGTTIGGTTEAAGTFTTLTIDNTNAEALIVRKDGDKGDVFVVDTSNGDIQVGVDGTGYDVKFYGSTSGTYLLWDESDDELDLSAVNLVLPVKTTTGNPASPVEGQIYVNTQDNKVRVYADSAWRDLATW